MKRETRINLIMLAALCAVMVPGGIRLAQLAYTEGRGPSSQPIAARPNVVYMDPGLYDPSIPRIAPPATVQWLQSLGARYRPAAATAQPPTGMDGEGNSKRIMSTGRTFELLDQWLGADQQLHVILVAWQNRFEHDGFTIGVEHEAKVAAMDLISRTALPLPPRIRQELTDAGYEDAPSHITMWHLRTPAPPAAAGFMLERRSGDEVVDRLHVR